MKLTSLLLLVFAQFSLSTSRDQLPLPELGEERFAKQLVGRPSLTDLLIISPRIRIFSDYFREAPTAYDRLVLQPRNAKNFSIFAPFDSAIGSMVRVPHSAVRTHRTESEVTIQDEKADRDHLDRWVSSHFSTEPVIDLPTTINSLVKGHRITIEEDSGQIVVNPGNAHVVDVIQANDGVLYIVDSVLTFDD